MDPQTVVLLLGLNLFTVGLLLALIGRRMDESQGMRSFAIGSMLFGLAFLVRLATGHQRTSLLSMLPDTLMVLATLLYITGLRQFVGQSAPRARVRALGTAVFAGFWLLAWLGWQDLGRHVALNTALAVNYLVLSAMALHGSRRVQGDMRLSLTVLCAVTGLMGLTTGARVWVAASAGLAPLFNGPLAGIYYGYSTFASVVLGPNLLWMVFLRLNGRLQLLATHDPLTGLLNRLGLDEALQRHFAARPPALPLVWCQFDIDHFKRVNDQHGHATGDAVLRAVAAALQAEVRGSDFLARLGGEEFLVGCVGGTDAALVLAERVRQAVAAQAHPSPSGGLLRCTLSAGVSPPFGDLPSWEAALRLADEALYRAKAEGRDSVRVAAPPLRPAPPQPPAARHLAP
ncbi:GGDEF domain-containing protein [Aquabacterium sp. OR-4]|uniref:GGDEF domain-containing protein n=1 Tax=Aquabacterium sp. OR-4 TaxID=2978127 RepID=UPI0028C65880|nr:GGDEF domain-containing protein [Aquabacterium sp. OR-4]MDT7838785.1 GGDEF domain-containing protein [Aquabacterium sp. OR-4]